MKKFIIICISFFLFGCTQSAPDSPDTLQAPDSPSTLTPTIMELTSPSFENDGIIPAQHTCDGANTSPELNWSGTPDGTQSFVLIVDDPDAVPVAGFVWDHWVLFNIPAGIKSITENSSAGTEGMTSFKKIGYGGPCPPNGEHKYFFKLYALDSNLDLDSSATKKDVETAMKDHILDQAELTGNYDRTK